MRPNDARFDEQNLPDDQPIAEERPEFYPQLKRFRLEKIAPDRAGRLRDGDPVELQSTPGRDADLAQTNWGVEALAEFLLNPTVHALRLDVKIHAEQNDACEHDRAGDQPEQDAPDCFHAGKITQRAIEEKVKAA